MTREEAISIMNVIIHMIEPQYDNDRVEEAIEMAIKALEQEEAIPFDFELFKAGLMNMPDGMTNGDVIKAVFPKANVWESAGRICVDGHGCLKTFSIVWWNAPYKAE